MGWAAVGAAAWVVIRRLFRGKWLFVFVAFGLCVPWCNAQFATCSGVWGGVQNPYGCVMPVDNKTIYAERTYIPAVDNQNGGPIWIGGDGTNHPPGAEDKWISMWWQSDANNGIDPINDRVSGYPCVILYPFQGYCTGHTLIGWHKDAPYPGGQDPEHLNGYNGLGGVTITVKRSSDSRFEYLMDVTFDNVPFATSIQLGARKSFMAPPLQSNPVNPVQSQAFSTITPFVDVAWWGYFDTYLLHGTPTGAPPASPHDSTADHPTGIGSVIYVLNLDPSIITGVTDPDPTTHPTSGPTTLPTGGSTDVYLYFEPDTSSLVKAHYADQDMVNPSAFQAAVAGAVPDLGNVPTNANFILMFPTEDPTASDATGAVNDLMTMWEVSDSGVGGGRGLPTRGITTVDGILGTCMSAFDSTSPAWPMVLFVRQWVRPVTTILIFLAFIEYLLVLMAWTFGMRESERFGGLLLGTSED